MKKAISFPSMNTMRASNGAKSFPSKNTEIKVPVMKKVSMKKEFPSTSTGKKPTPLPIRGMKTRNA